MLHANNKIQNIPRLIKHKLTCSPLQKSNAWIPISYFFMFNMSQKKVFMNEQFASTNVIRVRYKIFLFQVISMNQLAPRLFLHVLACYSYAKTNVDTDKTALMMCHMSYIDTIFCPQ